jgi:hypothetical protein
MCYGATSKIGTTTPASAWYSRVKSRSFLNKAFHAFQLAIFTSLFTPCKMTHNSCSSGVALSKQARALCRVVNRHFACGSGRPLAKTAWPRSVQRHGREAVSLALSPAMQQADEQDRIGAQQFTDPGWNPLFVALCRMMPRLQHERFLHAMS